MKVWAHFAVMALIVGLLGTSVSQAALNLVVELDRPTFESGIDLTMQGTTFDREDFQQATNAGGFTDPEPLNRANPGTNYPPNALAPGMDFFILPDVPDPGSPGQFSLFEAPVASADFVLGPGAEASGTPIRIEFDSPGNPTVVPIELVGLDLVGLSHINPQANFGTPAVLDVMAGGNLLSTPPILVDGPRDRSFRRPLGR